MRRLLSPPAAISALLASAPTVLGVDGGGAARDPVLGDPLLPYVVALLVAGLTLLILGILVVVTGRGKSGASRRTQVDAGWWACRACGAHNAPDRTECYACRASRADETDLDDRDGPAVPPEA